ncbi:MAG: hypothetical protein BWY77_01744 [bacterium ADurb.Bin431]|nr:MAG: hypothetical protein BWY77_01744 [bacterium ADurb.Bin431]
MLEVEPLRHALLDVAGPCHRFLKARMEAEPPHRRRRGEERERLLLQASTVLGSTLDHQAILHQLARLALPRYADWCLLEVVEDDGQVGVVAGAHVHPEREELVIELAGQAGALGGGRGVLAAQLQHGQGGIVGDENRRAQPYGPQRQGGLRRAGAPVGAIQRQIERQADGREGGIQQVQVAQAQQG